MISTSNANFLRKKKKIKKQGTHWKKIKLIYKTTQTVFLCSESTCTYTSIGCERGAKIVRSYGMMQEQKKPHSPWNALQDIENLKYYNNPSIQPVLMK